MPIQYLSNEFSNWETVALILIKSIIIGGNPHFSRSELMKIKNLDNAEKILIFFEHKIDPQKSEHTLQRTIQNLRDKGLIEFLGEGEYKLTKRGFEAIKNIDPKRIEWWETIKNLSLKEVKALLEKYS